MHNQGVRYDYFYTGCKVFNTATEEVETEELYDIKEIFENLLDIEAQERTELVNGEPCRIQTLVKHHGIYKIQVLRLRENVIPGIANDDGDFEIIELHDGEYVAEYNAIIYDSVTKVLMLHRNRNAMTPSRMEDYLSEFLVPGCNVILTPIIKESTLANIRRKPIYRSLRVRVIGDESRDASLSEDSCLRRLIRAAKDLDPNSIDLYFGIGRGKKGDSLSLEKTREIIAEAHGKEYIDKIEVSYKNDLDSKVEHIDLIEDRLHDECNFSLDEKEPLIYEKVIESMATKYHERVSNGEFE